MEKYGSPPKNKTWAIYESHFLRKEVRKTKRPLEVMGTLKYKKHRRFAPVPSLELEAGMKNGEKRAG